MNKLIVEFENKQMKNQWPVFAVGDTIVVSKEILEGKKKRIQKFQGLVIKMQNTRSRQTATVRKMVPGCGVEKTFLLQSPLIADIEVVRKGSVRRAKLYYLRDRIGKRATRVKAAQE